MARKPQPVDPADGPIPAFAYDLRLVREEAGNPTYRALAALAGFSATTLSEAARGVRQPSLEVTLAYVGACGGDVEYWQRRWRELDLLLTQDWKAPEPSEPAIVSPDPPQQTPQQPPQHPPHQTRRPFPRRSRIAGVALLAAACVLFGLLGPRLGPRLSGATRAAQPVAATASAGPAHCEGTDPTPAAFHGTVYSPITRIRSGASRNSPVVRQVAGTCVLEFTGYCLGDVIIDATAGSPDLRWYRLSGGGVVASAVVHGNPPTDMQPSRCSDDAPAPTSITLSAVQPPTGPELLQLSATGRNVAIVGYAAYFTPYSAGSDGPGAMASPPRWQQLGMSDAAADGFPVTWRLGPLHGRDGGPGGIPVVAVACLGGDGPTDIIDAQRVQPTPPQPTPPQPAQLGADDLQAAARAACHFPDPS